MTTGGSDLSKHTIDQTPFGVSERYARVTKDVEEFDKLIKGEQSGVTARGVARQTLADSTQAMKPAVMVLMGLDRSNMDKQIPQPPQGFAKQITSSPFLMGSLGTTQQAQTFVATVRNVMQHLAGWTQKEQPKSKEGEGRASDTPVQTDTEQPPAFKPVARRQEGEAGGNGLPGKAAPMPSAPPPAVESAAMAAQMAPQMATAQGSAPQAVKTFRETIGRQGDTNQALMDKMDGYRERMIALRGGRGG